jgi:hypothetical protein
MFRLAAVDLELLLNPMANKPSAIVAQLHRIVNNTVNMLDSQGAQHLIRIGQAALVNGAQRILVLNFGPLNAQHSPMLWTLNLYPPPPQDAQSFLCYLCTSKGLKLTVRYASPFKSLKMRPAKRAGTTLTFVFPVNSQLHTTVAEKTSI